MSPRSVPSRSSPEESKRNGGVKRLCAAFGSWCCCLNPSPRGSRAPQPPSCRAAPPRGPALRHLPRSALGLRGGCCRVRALPAPRPGPPPRSDRGRCPGQRLAPAAAPHPRASGGFQRVPDSACSVRGVRAVCAASVCLGPVAVVLSHIHEPEVIITIFPNLKSMKSEMLNHKLILQEELTEEMPYYFSILLCQ